MRLEHRFRNFGGVNNSYGNENVGENEAVDMNNISLEPTGTLSKGKGAYDLNYGSPMSGAASSVLGMRFNSLKGNYKAVLGLGTAASFFDYSPTANTWTMVGYSDGQTASIFSNTNLVKWSGTSGTGAWNSQVVANMYFKFDTWSTWWLVSACSATGIKLGTTPYTTLSASGKYTIRYGLDQVNFNNYENPTLQNLSYWHSPDESTSLIYKWDESNNWITRLTDTDLPSDPKRMLAFKNRLWVSTGIYTGDPSWSIESSTYHKYTFDTDGTDSGNGTTKSLTTGANTSFTAGFISNAANCDFNAGTGIGGGLTYADDAEFEPGVGDFTICGWYKPSSGSGTIFSKGDYGLSVNSLNVSFSYPSGHTHYSDNIPSGTWVFLWVRRIGTSVMGGFTPSTAPTFNTTPMIAITNSESLGVNATGLSVGTTAGYNQQFIDQLIYSKGTGFTDDQLTGLFNKGAGTTSTSYSGSAGGVPNRLYFSDSNDYDNWTNTNYIDIPTNTKDQMITCLAAYYDTLIIGTTDAIWTLYGTGGNPATDWSLKKSNSSVGIKENSQTAIVGPYLAFVGYDGYVWAFDGNSSFRIGDKLEVNESCEAESMVSYKGNLYGIYDNAGVYMFDTDKKAWLKSDMPVRCLYTDGVYLYGGSNKDGKVYRMFEGDTFSGALTSYFESKWYDFGKPEENKTFFDAWAYMEPQSHSGTLNFTFYKDYDTATVASFALSQSTSLTPQNGIRMVSGLNGINGKHWKMRISNANANQPFQINKIVLRADMPDWAASDIRRTVQL